MYYFQISYMYYYMNMDIAIMLPTTDCAVLNHSVMSDSVTSWTVARQAPLSTGILQARTLECVAMHASRGSSQPMDQTQVSHIAGRFFTV